MHWSTEAKNKSIGRGFIHIQTWYWPLTAPAAVCGGVRQPLPPAGGREGTAENEAYTNILPTLTCWEENNAGGGAAGKLCLRISNQLCQVDGVHSVERFFGDLFSPIFGAPESSDVLTAGGTLVSSFIFLHIHTSYWKLVRYMKSKGQTKGLAI